MTTRDRGREESRRREVARNGAQLASLTAFAFAQPLLDILGKNPAFFAVRGSTSSQIVLFALAVVIVPPAALLALELLARVAGPAPMRTLHVVLVGSLVAVIALYVLTKRELLDGAAAVAVAAAIGVGAALLFARAKAMRTFLLYLAPAPLLFLALFLFDSGVTKLVFPAQEAQAKTVAVDSRTPVVLVVFDELPTVTLMNRRGGIDAARFPHFAALARDSTWYRNSTTVAPHTHLAVPAILDGKLPQENKLPVLADHPQNLFTFLGGSYQIDAVEALTHLCPPKLCKQAKRKAARLEPASGDENGSLASDAGVVYLHLLLPAPYAGHLPPISNTWGNFGGKEEEARVETQPFCGRNICRLASLIHPAGTRPPLYFVHSLLPHVPWLYLPSGKRYGGNVRLVPGAPAGTFGHDRWLATQAMQRYLLQLGYTDEALGLLMRKLRETGVYDRALIVVTADHGLSFRLGEPRRNLTRRNLVDLAFQPLFVKLPGQKRGRVDDGFAQTIDILPTIAATLRTRLPWRSDGKLLGRRLPADGTVSVLGPNGTPMTADLRTLVAERRRSLARQVATFGTGKLDRVYRIGPHRQLLGRDVGSLRVRPSRSETVEISGRELLGVVDSKLDLVPSYVTGTVGGKHPPQQDLAVAVNGRIEAVTRSYQESGATRFAALVPERSLHAGANEVAVYAVAGSTLEELRGSDVTYSLSPGAAALVTSDGTMLPLRATLKGEVRGTRSASGSTLGGWAADLKSKRPADSVVVLVDGNSVFAGTPGNITRKDVSERFGVDGAGFIFRLPGDLLPAAGPEHQVRVFAVGGGAAHELGYLDGYPWSTR